MDERLALTALSEEQRRQALERFQALRPFLEEGVPLAAVARERAISLRTARYWVRQYRRHGLAGLVRRPRSDRGRRHLPDDLVGLIEGLALRRPPPSVASIHRQVAVVAAAHGWPAPRYDRVHDIVRWLDPALVMLAHEGAKAYKETFDLLYRHQAAAPNETWQADHTPLDLWVLDERGKPARPWLTVLDDYSRAVAGYSLSLHAPSALQTALALRQAIWHKADAHWRVCGIPASSTPTMGRTSPRGTWHRSPPTSRCAWSSRRRGSHAGAARSSASSRPSISSSCASCPATRRRAPPRPPRR